VRRTFLDEGRERRLERDGYVVLDGLDAAEVATLREGFFALWPEGEGFHTDLERADAATRASVDALVGPVWDRHLPAVLDDHRVFMSSFLVKWPGPGNDLYVHQDTTYVDEGRYRSVSFWVALDDMSPEIGNGPLEVAPGSHRWADEYRGSNVVPWHRRHEERVRAALVTVPVRAGQVVVMDNRLIHASPANTTDRPRVAVAAAAVPREADLLHAVALGDDRVGLVRVDDGFYAASTPQGLMADPPSGPYFAEVPQLRRAPEGESTPPGADEARDSRPPGSEGIGRVLGRLLAANHRRQAEAWRDRPGPVFGAETLPWLADLEDAWADLRAEYDAVRATGVRPIPMELLAGDDFGEDGTWDAFVLCHNGGWVADNVERFPVTAAWLRRLPGLRAATFSVLGPGARIPPHRGANNGVLRSHLGVVVPGSTGDGVLEVGSCVVAWEEGRAFAFDDSYVHAARNGADTERVVLMLETDRPTEGRTDRRNRLVQRAFAAHPQVRGGHARIREVDAAVNPG
jgi:beta-hydroxylase